ncbi:MAG: DegV family protein [Clostridiales bacterium]|jgi:DegV family protein with EDD domain|nr:DegV family protein [Clostridiales bacterium]
MTKYGIIVDSCCDMTSQLAGQLGVTTVPLIMRLGQKEFIDDDALDLPGFMAEMKACKEKVGSASPPPVSFAKAMIAAGRSFVVTLSSQLSGTYSSAEMGKTYAQENGVTDVHVFDSKSASAGQLLVAVKIRELLAHGLPRDQIIKSVNHFIDGMKTYFVLERHDNLLKNGRLNKITEKIISIMNIKLVMGSDKTGNIALYAKPRGTKQMLEKMTSFVSKSGRPTSGENMVISHCNNLPLAGQLSSMIKQRFDFKEILIVPTRGISSLYADDKGIVMAF